MSVLELQNVTMRFGGLTAADDVSFKVNRGEIVSLIGPNGAGKTTLFNIITGIYEPTQGRVLVDSKDPSLQLSRSTLVTFLLFGLATSIALFTALNIEQLWDAAFTQHYVYRQAFAWGQVPSSLAEFIRSLDGFSLALPLLCGFILGVGASWVTWKRATRSPDVIVTRGFSRTFQNIRIFHQMSVVENVMVGLHSRLNSSVLANALSLPSSRHEQRTSLARAEEILKLVGLFEQRSYPASKLPYAHQRRLEIARALATKPNLILLDEPAAGMNPTESSELMQLIRAIRDRDITVLLIEHHMKVVMGISDRVVVLDHGEKIAEGTPAEVRANPKVIEAYLGAGSTHAG